MLLLFLGLFLAMQAVLLGAGVVMLCILAFTFLHSSPHGGAGEWLAKNAREVGHLDRHLTATSTIPDGFVPIAIGPCNGMQTVVTLCKLNFKAQTKAPFKYPMFRDLVAVSGCTDAKRTMKLTLAEVQERLPSYLDPAGFIFHESRVGSTLVANILAADPENLVFSESAPPPAIALHCAAPEEEKVRVHVRVCICVYLCASVCASVCVSVCICVCL